MYVDEYEDGHVEVTYLTAHSGHELGSNQLPYLPLPNSTKETVALKISQGIPPGRIIDGNSVIILIHNYFCSLFHYYAWVDIREGVGDRNKRSEFLQCVSRKHFITKQDVRNIRAKVNDPLIMRHKHDPTSVRASVCVHITLYNCIHTLCILAVMFLCQHCAQGGPLCGWATAGKF